MANVKAVPEGMQTVTPQLNVDGAAEAIEFIKKAFGGEEIDRALDPSGKKVWHCMMRIGTSMIFVNDASAEMGAPANPTRLWLYAEDVDGRFKRATDAGAKITMPVSDMFWGDRMGMVSDRWGNVWALAQRTKNMTPEEMKKAGDEFAASMGKPGGK